MTYDDNNVFAKILRGELPCKKIYEDDAALAFYTIEPKAKVHAVVAIKGSYVDYPDFLRHAGSEIIADFSRACRKTAEALGLDKTGYRLVINTGKDSGQTIPHLHAHVLGGEDLDKCGK